MYLFLFFVSVCAILCGLVSLINDKLDFAAYLRLIDSEVYSMDKPKQGDLLHIIIITLGFGVAYLTAPLARLAVLWLKNMRW